MVGLAESFPLVREAAKEHPEFTALFGIFGLHRYEVTCWSFLTQCFLLIHRHGAALKCLYKTLSQLKSVIKPCKAKASICNSPLNDLLDELFSHSQVSVLLNTEKVFGDAYRAILHCERGI